MPDIEYNLLHEPWIIVMHPTGLQEKVSMLTVFERANEYLGLAGELPTQDVAVLRLLLAVLHTVFSRFEADGSPAQERSGSDIKELWKTLWNSGKFPYEVIKKYLLQYEDRFYLFHPQRPFYQVASMADGTKYKAAKLNGELSESSNKVRLFPQRTGSGKNNLNYDEAARWLLYVNSFDDTSSKPKGKSENGEKLPSPGAGWLGQLGLIYAVGDNLFETLMLNLVLLDETNEPWDEECPVWEAKCVNGNERCEIVVPYNQSELLTLQSRRLLLDRENGVVTGYILLGGDFFPKANAFEEQMTIWRNTAKKKEDAPEYVPKRHDPARQLWRDFSALFAQKDSVRPPGVIAWLAKLQGEVLISKQFKFQTAAVKYGDKDFFIDDVFGDSIAFNAGLLENLSAAYVQRVIGEIETTEKLVTKVGVLARDIELAAGNADGARALKEAREQAYFRLDRPFRTWLAAIDPACDELHDICERWWAQAQQIVRALGRELVSRAGTKAFVGREDHTAPDAYNKFLYYTSTREALIKGGAKND